MRELNRALESGLCLEEAFVCEPLCRSVESRDLLGRLQQAGTHLLHVPPAVFSKLTFGDRAEGLLGVASTPQRPLAELRLPSQPLVAVLEGVEKPGNLGGVLRSADAAGVSALIVADGITDLYNPNVIRASLGAIFTVPVCDADSGPTLQWLLDQGLTVFAARVDGDLHYTHADFRGPAAIILGSEVAGLSSTWKSPQVRSIRVPMLGSIDSLNISATAAILFYEALRQRQAGG